MIGQLESLCTHFPFQCTMALIGVMSQNKFGYIELLL